MEKKKKKKKKKILQKKLLMLSVEWFSDLSPSKVCLSTNQGTFASSFMFLPQFEVFFC